MAFNPEDLIRWEELSNSLQERFRNIEASLNSQLAYFTSLNNGYRITISAEPPLHPEKDKDIWVDLNYRIVRFYMSRNNDGNYGWEFTRAAWYGGSASDVKDIINASPLYNYSRLKSLIWIGNVSVNGAYTAANENPRSERFVCPVGGWYRLQDKSMLFQYNKQFNYTHDGGRLNITVVLEKKITANSFAAPQQIYTATYDSNPDNGYRYRAYDPSLGQWPEVPIQLAEGDRVTSYASTQRDPLSTDTVQIIQVQSVQIYRLNSGSYTDRIVSTVSPESY